MSRTKADPSIVKAKVVRKKLFFIGLIITLVGMTNLIVYKGGKSPKGNTNESRKETITKTPSFDKEKKLVMEAAKSAQQTSEKVLGVTTAYIEDAQEKVQTSVQDVVFNTTIKPFIDRFDSLPHKQQESVREIICKPEKGGP